MKTVAVDAARIRDATSFHETFSGVFGFPAFYGRNMSAWIDCMSYLDEPGAAMSSVVVAPGELLVLEVTNASDLKSRCPELWQEFLECAAFVNWRRTERGDTPLLVVSAYA